MSKGLKSAWSQARTPGSVVEELASQLEASAPRAIVFFAAHPHDARVIGLGLRGCFPEAEVVGCTTAGEFTQRVHGEGGVAALGLGAPVVVRAAATLARFESGVAVGMRRALTELGTRLGADARELDPRRHVGVALLEGLHGSEEEANATLGQVAPLLRVVGGSAGDNLAFQRTRVVHAGEESEMGAALLLLECGVPFTVVKTCSFEPMGPLLTVTRAAADRRVVYALDGQPVAQVYARATDTRPEALDSTVFRRNPFGLLVDGEPWIRSPQRLLPDGGLKFYCRMTEGMQVHVMRPTPLIPDTRRAMLRAAEALGGHLRGGLAFNCILRRLELDALGLHEAFLETFRGAEVAGFHTYGESFVGHVNQTLTALLFG